MSRFFLPILLLASMANAMQEQTVMTSDDVALRVVEQGTGPSLIFVPGWGMDGDIWKRQFEYFSKNYRVISYDPRGQGASDKPATGYATSRRAEDILELALALKIKDPVIIGWSLGALDSCEALRQGLRARAVVLIDNSVDKKYASSVAPGGRLLKWLEKGPYDQVVADTVKDMFKMHVEASVLEGIIQRAQSMPREAAIESLKKGSSGQGLSALLRAKPLPVLLAVTPRFKAEAERLKKDFPGIKVEVYEKAGHALFVDEADRFNKSLENFLKSLP